MFGRGVFATLLRLAHRLMDNIICRLRIHADGWYAVCD